MLAFDGNSNPIKFQCQFKPNHMSHRFTVPNGIDMMLKAGDVSVFRALRCSLVKCMR